MILMRHVDASLLSELHPQLGFEIARKARDTIQTLDSRLRGNDDVLGGEATRNYKTHPKAARLMDFPILETP